ESNRVDDRTGEARTGQTLGLPIEEREVEARVVRDECRIPCECEQPSHRDSWMRRAAQVRVAQSRQCADRRAERDAWIDERVELLGELQLAHPHRADL